MIRFLVFLPLSILSTLGAAFWSFLMALLMLPLFIFNRRDWEDRWAHWWGVGLLKIAGVQVHASGLENLPSLGTGTIFVFNHTSHYDIAVCHAQILRSFRFGAKAELFQIPVFGWAMAHSGALRIERQNRQASLGLYQQSVKRIQNGESFVLAPEGTRQKNEVVGPFKSGPFIFALQAGCAVTPLVIQGANRVISKSLPLIRRDLPRVVYFSVLPPVDLKGMGLDQREPLKSRVRSLMAQELLRLQTIASSARRRKSLPIP